MFAGGEFYDDPRWLKDKPTISTAPMSFLNGGKACLVVISEILKSQGINKILLPAYICPTVLTTLEHCELTCEYYQIREDFSLDLEDLAQKCRNHRAVYFINYFGFFHSTATQSFLAQIRNSGAVLIEDNAQAGFCEHTVGDFVFNSIRKLAPFDGGYLLSPVDPHPFIERFCGVPIRRLPVIRKYRQQLAEYLFGSTANHDELKRLYELAELHYETDHVVEGDPEERRTIERLDWEGIKQIRRENYTYLLSLLKDLPGLSPIFTELQENNLPLGLPVYVSGMPRDRLFDELGNAGIGLTIHWEEIINDPRLNQNPVAVEMAQKILTFVIDQRTSHKQMDYVVEKVMSCYSKANRPLPD